MAHEDATGRIIGLLEGLLTSAHAGKLKGIAVVAVTNHEVPGGLMEIPYASGALADDGVKEAITRGLYLLRADFMSYVWDRVPAGPALP